MEGAYNKITSKNREKKGLSDSTHTHEQKGVMALLAGCCCSVIES